MAWQNWEQLTADPWVRSTVRHGLRIPLLARPHQRQAPRQMHLAQAEQVALQEALSNMAAAGGHRAHYSARRDIQEHALHGTQERWSMEASVQPQSAERVCGQLPFQDGNVGSRTRASSAELVVGETRSEGRLSLGTGAHSQPTPPPVHVERPGMAVHLPPVRSVGVTPHVHQGASSSSSVAPYNGSAHGCLSGRLAVDSTLPCSSGAADPVCGSPPRTTGLHSQPPEIYHGADADPDVSRSRSELGAHGIFLASRQAGQDSLRVPSPAQQGICYPRRTAFTDRQDGCSAPCSTPRYASCPGDCSSC